MGLPGRRFCRFTELSCRSQDPSQFALLNGTKPYVRSPSIFSGELPVAISPGAPRVARNDLRIKMNQLWHDNVRVIPFAEHFNQSNAGRQHAIWIV